MLSSIYSTWLTSVDNLLHRATQQYFSSQNSSGLDLKNKRKKMSRIVGTCEYDWQNATLSKIINNEITKYF